MNFNVKDIATISMVLFAVIDAIGAIPIIITMRSKVGEISPMKVTLVSGAIMIVFLFLGTSILQLIGIDLPSFAIAGSFILFILAIEMILGIKISKEETSTTATIVPISFPIIAGAGTLTTLISLRAQYVHVENIIVGILINLVIVYLVLRNMYRLEKILGPSGISLLKKVFGIILLALAVKLFKSNA